MLVYVIYTLILFVFSLIYTQIFYLFFYFFILQSTVLKRILLLESHGFHENRIKPKYSYFYFLQCCLWILFSIGNILLLIILPPLFSFSFLMPIFTVIFHRQNRVSVTWNRANGELPYGRAQDNRQGLLIISSVCVGKRNSVFFFVFFSYLIFLILVIVKL